MLSNVKMTFAAVAAALAVGLPSMALAVAANQPMQGTYSTALTQVQPLPYGPPVTGDLRLTVSSDGIISGWFIPTDETRFIPVVGGVTNGYFWLDIGQRADLRVTGSVQKNGTLAGIASAVREPMALNALAGAVVSFDFVAKPQ